MKLEDIQKKDIFKTPEGYFDGLPHQIQSKVVAQSSGNMLWRTKAVRYALSSATLLILILTFWVLVILPPEPANTEELLADVSTEDIIDYLHDADITTAEIITTLDLESAEFDWENGNALIEELADDQLDVLLKEYEVIDTLL